MFREMRRKKQALLFEECAEILKKGASGVLAVSGDFGYPYAVPLSYAYDGAKIYFHCAKCGHKLDSIQRNSKVSFALSVKIGLFRKNIRLVLKVSLRLERYVCWRMNRISGGRLRNWR